MGVLSEDAIALHEALGGDDQAVLIGHDYGAEAQPTARRTAPLSVEACRHAWRCPGDAFVTFVDEQFRPTASAAGTCSSSSIRLPRRSSFQQTTLPSSIVSGRNGRQDLTPPKTWALLKPSLRDPSNLSAALGLLPGHVGAAWASTLPSTTSQAASFQGVPTQPTLYLHGTTDGCIGVGGRPDGGQSGRPTTFKLRDRRTRRSLPASRATSRGQRSDHRTPDVVTCDSRVAAMDGGHQFDRPAVRHRHRQASPVRRI